MPSTTPPFDAAGAPDALSRIDDWERHFRGIYRDSAGAYDDLVAAEDADGHLADALRALLPGSLRRALDIGAGTGRMTRMLADIRGEPSTIVALDAATPMLREGAARHAAAGRPWLAATADAMHLPVRSGAFDAAVAGWVFGHVREWHPATWAELLARALAEARRAVRAGGLVAVVDTLGTGRAAPAAPTAALAEYHAWLERAGLTRMVVRTDYRFASVEEAARRVGFFFGPEMAAAVRAAGVPHVPEWTGVWWEHRRSEDEPASRDSRR